MYCARCAAPLVAQDELARLKSEIVFSAKIGTNPVVSFDACAPLLRPLIPAALWQRIPLGRSAAWFVTHAELRSLTKRLQAVSQRLDAEVRTLKRKALADD